MFTFERQACPNAVDLLAFIRGQLLSAEADQITQHIKDCPACAEALDNLKSAAEPDAVSNAASPSNQAPFVAGPPSAAFRTLFDLPRPQTTAPGQFWTTTLANPLEPSGGHSPTSSWDYELPTTPAIIVILVDEAHAYNPGQPAVIGAPISFELAFRARHDVSVYAEENPLGQNCVIEVWNQTPILKAQLGSYLGTLDEPVVSYLQRLAQVYPGAVPGSAVPAERQGPAIQHSTDPVVFFQAEEIRATDYLRQPFYEALEQELGNPDRPDLNDFREQTLAWLEKFYYRNALYLFVERFTDQARAERRGQPVPAALGGQPEARRGHQALLDEEEGIVRAVQQIAWLKAALRLSPTDNSAEEFDVQAALPEDETDFLLELGPASSAGYALTCRSATGQRQRMVHLPLHDLAWVRQLSGWPAAPRSGRAGRDPRSLEAQMMQRIGQGLFDALFSEEVWHLYAESHQRTARKERPLRLRLHIKAPELAVLPWEYLYDERQESYLAIEDDIALVRSAALPLPIQPLRTGGPLHVLCMLAQPGNLEPFDLLSEQQRITQALGDLEQRGWIRVTWVEGQTPGDLQEKLQQDSWHIFHLIGHGAFDARTGEGMIALANEQSQATWLPATALARLLGDTQSLRLVVLNTCVGARDDQQGNVSGTAAALARHGIQAVLAMQAAMSEQASITFLGSFYEHLTAGRQPVDRAVMKARQDLQKKKSLEWGIPALYLRSADGRLFDFASFRGRRSGYSRSAGG